MEVRNKVKAYEEIKECHTVDDDDPLTESEQKELCKRFKSLHYDYNIFTRHVQMLTQRRLNLE